MTDVRASRDAITAHYASGQFAEGDRLLREAGQVIPEHVRLECEGTRFFYERKLQEAIRCYEAAIMLKPDYGIARYQYLVGIKLERTGQLVPAFERYRYAVEIEPTFVDPYVELGGLLGKIGDFEGALECYREAVRIEPTDVANHHNLRAVLSKLAAASPAQYGDELRAADAACQGALKNDPQKELKGHQW